MYINTYLSAFQKCGPFTGKTSKYDLIKTLFQLFNLLTYEESLYVEMFNIYISEDKKHINRASYWQHTFLRQNYTVEILGKKLSLLLQNRTSEY